MTTLGQLALWLALLIAAWGSVVGVYGGLTGRSELMQSARRSSYALLERGRTAAQRAALAAEIGVPQETITDFVHRADVTRMAFLAGRMVRMLWAIGVTSLEALRRSEPEDLLARVTEHYDAVAKGKPFDLAPKTARGMIMGARGLPAVVEE